jgi:hypothetical protein
VSGAWVRLGALALDVSPASSWAVSHAALPVLEPIDSGAWSLYISVRDRDGRARIARSRLHMRPEAVIAPLEPDPVLDLGTLGTFDDSGVVTSCLVRDGSRRYLFYTGWSRGVSVPFYLGIGLAVSDDAHTFVRVSRAPVVERSDADPFQTASPFVAIEGDRWRMWYVSGTGWTTRHDSPAEPCYNIRYRESRDGVAWTSASVPCIDYGNDEHAFGRPWVVRDEDGYRMWFSVRGDRYRIGCAESADGLRWTRADGRAGLHRAEEGWDSEMVEYPCLFEHEGRRYMLYNGNDYGRTGLGLAVWDPGRR